MSDVKTSKLTAVREQIMQVDDHLQALLEQRAELALQVAVAKRELVEQPDFYRPEREAELLRNRLIDYQGLIPKSDLAMIFRSIMSTCRGLQEKPRVAFLGPEGTFSHAATQLHFGSAIELIPAQNIEQVFREVDSNQAQYGVIPIENSTDGVINISLDLLIKYSLNICGEIMLPIEQHLLRSAKDTDVINSIYSHQQSFLQCKHWLEKNYPDAECIVVSSNGKAAQMLANKQGVAAIAGDSAADYYGLIKQYSNIEDNPKNTTRFLVIGKQYLDRSGKDKTSLIITTPHQPGTLIDLMQPFAENNVNVTFIQSRPYQHQNWRYIFFVELEGHQQDDNIAASLAALSNKPIMFTILGSYPEAV